MYLASLLEACALCWVYSSPAQPGHRTHLSSVPQRRTRSSRATACPTQSRRLRHGRHLRSGFGFSQVLLLHRDCRMPPAEQGTLCGCLGFASARKGDLQMTGHDFAPSVSC